MMICRLIEIGSYIINITKIIVYRFFKGYGYGYGLAQPFKRL
jgi:hypothetical protein